MPSQSMRQACLPRGDGARDGVRGAATFGVGDRVVQVSQGELLTFPSGQDHVLLESSADLYLFAIGLKPRYSAQVLKGDAPLPMQLKLDKDELQTITERANSVRSQLRDNY